MTQRIVGVALALAGLLAAGSAQAHVDVTVGIALPGVSAVIGAPVYRAYPPAPVYVEPAPVYVEPAPVYVEPAPVYLPPRAYYRPAPVYAPAPVVWVGERDGWRRRWYRDHDRRSDHERDHDRDWDHDHDRDHHERGWR